MPPYKALSTPTEVLSGESLKYTLLLTDSMKELVKTVVAHAALCDFYHSRAGVVSVSATVTNIIHPTTGRSCPALRMKLNPQQATPALTTTWAALVTSVRDALCFAGAEADAGMRFNDAVRAAFRTFQNGVGA